MADPGPLPVGGVSDSTSSVMAALLVGLVPVVLLTFIRVRKTKSPQQQGITVEVGGEKGLTKRNHRFLSPVETPWEGVNSLAILFEQACMRYSGRRLLGTRKLISQETVTEDGRTLEKVTLGNYAWISYGQAFQRVLNFASGLVAIGHQKRERVGIFAETRAEWFLALQVRIISNFPLSNLPTSLSIHLLLFSEVVGATLDAYSRVSICE